MGALADAYSLQQQVPTQVPGAAPPPSTGGFNLASPQGAATALALGPINAATAQFATNQHSGGWLGGLIGNLYRDIVGVPTGLYNLAGAAVGDVVRSPIGVLEEVGSLGFAHTDVKVLTPSFVAKIPIDFVSNLKNYYLSPQIMSHLYEHPLQPVLDAATIAGGAGAAARFATATGTEAAALGAETAARAGTEAAARAGAEVAANSADDLARIGAEVAQVEATNATVGAAATGSAVLPPAGGMAGAFGRALAARSPGLAAWMQDNAQLLADYRAAALARSDVPGALQSGEAVRETAALADSMGVIQSQAAPITGVAREGLRSLGDLATEFKAAPAEVRKAMTLDILSPEPLAVADPLSGHTFNVEPGYNPFIRAVWSDPVRRRFLTETVGEWEQRVLQPLRDQAVAAEKSGTILEPAVQQQLAQAEAAFARMSGEGAQLVSTSGRYTGGLYIKRQIEGSIARMVSHYSIQAMLQRKDVAYDLGGIARQLEQAGQLPADVADRLHLTLEGLDTSQGVHFTPEELGTLLEQKGWPTPEAAARDLVFQTGNYQALTPDETNGLLRMVKDGQIPIQGLWRYTPGEDLSSIPERTAFETKFRQTATASGLSPEHQDLLMLTYDTAARAVERETGRTMAETFGNMDMRFQENWGPLGGKELRQIGRSAEEFKGLSDAQLADARAAVRSSTLNQDPGLESRIVFEQRTRANIAQQARESVSKLVPHTEIDPLIKRIQRDLNDHISATDAPYSYDEASAVLWDRTQGVLQTALNDVKKKINALPFGQRRKYGAYQQRLQTFIDHGDARSWDELARTKFGKDLVDRVTTELRSPELAMRIGSEIRGATLFGPEFKTLTRIFSTGDFTTYIHEFGHVLRRVLPEDIQATLHDVYLAKAHPGQTWEQVARNEGELFQTRTNPTAPNRWATYDTTNGVEIQEGQQVLVKGAQGTTPSGEGVTPEGQIGRVVGIREYGKKGVVAEVDVRGVGVKRIPIDQVVPAEGIPTAEELGLSNPRGYDWQTLDWRRKNTAIANANGQPQPSSGSPSLAATHWDSWTDPNGVTHTVDIGTRADGSVNPVDARIAELTGKQGEQLLSFTMVPEYDWTGGKLTLRQKVYAELGRRSHNGPPIVTDRVPVSELYKDSGAVKGDAAAKINIEQNMDGFAKLEAAIASPDEIIAPSESDVQVMDALEEKVMRNQRGPVGELVMPDNEVGLKLRDQGVYVTGVDQSKSLADTWADVPTELQPGTNVVFAGNNMNGDVGTVVMLDPKKDVQLGNEILRSKYEALASVDPNDYERMPIVYKYGDMKVAAEGNHRIYRARQAGEAKLKVLLVDGETKVSDLVDVTGAPAVTPREYNLQTKHQFIVDSFQSTSTWPDIQKLLSGDFADKKEVVAILKNHAKTMAGGTLGHQLDGWGYELRGKGLTFHNYDTGETHTLTLSQVADSFVQEKAMKGVRAQIAAEDAAKALEPTAAEITGESPAGIGTGVEQLTGPTEADWTAQRATLEKSFGKADAENMVKVLQKKGMDPADGQSVMDRALSLYSDGKPTKAKAAAFKKLNAAARRGWFNKAADSIQAEAPSQAAGITSRLTNAEEQAAQDAFAAKLAEATPPPENAAAPVAAPGERAAEVPPAVPPPATPPAPPGGMGPGWTRDMEEALATDFEKWFYKGLKPDHPGILPAFRIIGQQLTDLWRQMRGQILDTGSVPEEAARVFDQYVGDVFSQMRAKGDQPVPEALYLGRRRTRTLDVRDAAQQWGDGRAVQQIPANDGTISVQNIRERSVLAADTTVPALRQIFGKGVKTSLKDVKDITARLDEGAVVKDGLRSRVIIPSWDQADNYLQQLSTRFDVLGVEDTRGVAGVGGQTGFKAYVVDPGHPDIVQEVEFATPLGDAHRDALYAHDKALNTIERDYVKEEQAISRLEMSSNPNQAGIQQALDEHMKALADLEIQRDAGRRYMEGYYEMLRDEVAKDFGASIPRSSFRQAMEGFRLFVAKHSEREMFASGYADFQKLFERAYLPLRIKSAPDENVIDIMEGKSAQAKSAYTLDSERAAAGEPQPLYFPHMQESDKFAYISPSVAKPGARKLAKNPNLRGTTGSLFSEGNYITDPFQVYSVRAARAIRMQDAFAKVQEITQAYGRPIAHPNQIQKGEYLFAPDFASAFYRATVGVDDRLSALVTSVDDPQLLSAWKELSAQMGRPMAATDVITEGLAKSLSLSDKEAAGLYQAVLDAIPKSQRELIGVTRRGLDLYAVPEHVMSELEHQTRRMGVNNFTVAWDSYTHLWRSLALYGSPRWILNNFIGNISMAALEGVKLREVLAAATDRTDRWYTHALADMTGRGGEIDRGWFGGADLYPAELAGRGAETTVGQLERMALGKIRASPIDVMKPFRAWKDFIKGFNTDMENLFREKGFLTGVRKDITGDYMDLPKMRNALRSAWTSKEDMQRMLIDGITPRNYDRGMNYMVKTFGDFSTLSPFERNFVRRYVAPFWGFYRHVGKMLIRAPFSHPFKSQLVAQLAREDEMMRAQYGPLPAYTDQMAPWGPIGPDGHVTFLSVAGPNPFNPFADLGLSVLHPVIQAGVEMVTGRDTFTGQEFTDPNVVTPYGSDQRFRIIRGPDGQPMDAIPVDKVTPSIGIEMLNQFPFYPQAKSLVAGGRPYDTEGLIGSIGNPALNSQGQVTQPYGIGNFLGQQAGLNIKNYDIASYQARLEQERQAALQMAYKQWAGTQVSSP